MDVVVCRLTRAESEEAVDIIFALSERLIAEHKNYYYFAKIKFSSSSSQFMYFSSRMN